jgi:hypothetical protein
MGAEGVAAQQRRRYPARRHGQHGWQIGAEVAGLVEHGPVGAEPDCRGRGALAFLPGRELGWVAPVAADRQPSDRVIALPDRLYGLVRASWVTSWSLAADELIVDYAAPGRDPAVGGGGSMALRLRSEPAALTEFVARAARVPSQAKRG